MFLQDVLEVVFRLQNVYAFRVQSVHFITVHFIIVHEMYTAVK